MKRKIYQLVSGVKQGLFALNKKIVSLANSS